MLATDSVVIHEKHQEIQRDLRSTVEWRMQQPAVHAEVWVPPSALSKSRFWSCRNTAHHRQRLPLIPLIITLNLHLKLFRWTLCCTQLTAMETHFPPSYLSPTFRKVTLLRKSTQLHVSYWVYIFTFLTWHMQVCLPLHDFPNKNHDSPLPCGFLAWKPQTLPFQSLCKWRILR